MNVLLTSVGRRPYLIDWFKDAQKSTGSLGLVIAADADRYSPARAFADVFEVAPLASDPCYAGWLGGLLRKHDIRLAISVNDFELSKWAQLPSDHEFEALIRLSSELQSIAEDKIEMFRSMTAAGVRVPRTWVLSELLSDRSLVDGDQDVVLKGRYGSASRGLRFTNVRGLEKAACDAFREVTNRDGSPANNLDDAVDLMIVQETIYGQEYGVDVVNDFDRNFAGVLARKKIKMRSGETDQAVSVEARPFVAIGAALSSAAKHRGLVDTDVIVDDHGLAWLIDVNPRFGGGYPFSHLAGADIPAAYLSWASGRRNESSIRYKVGIESAKYVGVTEVPR